MLRFNVDDLEKFDAELKMDEVPSRFIKAIYEVATQACIEFLFQHVYEQDYIEKVDEIKKELFFKQHFGLLIET
ncbi:hypothetical protein TRFO_38951 [Tritrichomonas foetus]|uniref:Uncharacterized protein n=1 Tax=Tritrichomonas foetus TaxID=1144522 RepID=A0A1J4J838_9EUKA|nr:hypothetical protein TRFO_38951 [Tritrichomonas foetus]|eukprot:OHS94849.1 hypothetical protein TRFO_38951 [Tritrichomonas foetus]